nr:MAG TPA: hypothetical protein [Caudoviricetes sp.]
MYLTTGGCTQTTQTSKQTNTKPIFPDGRKYKK